MIFTSIMILNDLTYYCSHFETDPISDSIYWELQSSFFSPPRLDTSPIGSWCGRGNNYLWGQHIFSAAD
jgi:hypothetical protein